MKTTARNRRVAMLALPLLLAFSGCGLATDFFNPDFFNQIGFDAATIIPPEGKIVVAFQNSTAAVASFSGFYLESEAGAAQNIFAQQLDEGEVQQLVLDCPVVAFQPGGFADDTAAIVETGEEGVFVEYAGSAIFVGDDFQCGDVIRVELVQLGTGDEVGYQLRVSVIPS